MFEEPQCDLHEGLPIESVSYRNFSSSLLASTPVLIYFCSFSLYLYLSIGQQSILPIWSPETPPEDFSCEHNIIIISNMYQNVCPHSATNTTQPTC